MNKKINNEIDKFNKRYGTNDMDIHNSDINIQETPQKFTNSNWNKIPPDYLVDKEFSNTKNEGFNNKKNNGISDIRRSPEFKSPDRRTSKNNLVLKHLGNLKETESKKTQDQSIIAMDEEEIWKELYFKIKLTNEEYKILLQEKARKIKI
jgi:hypothetical protein